MSASTTDKITDTFNAANPNVAKVTATRSAAGTTLTCDNLAGWPTASKVHFSTYQVNTAGEYVDGTQIDWSGIVTSSTSIGSLTRKAGATDNGNAVGDYVEMNPTANWAQDLSDALTLEHSRTGVHALTSNSTMTSPKVITSINDTNGNELLKVTATSSAVNEFTLANAATGNPPSFTASGGDTNIGVNLVPKGTGALMKNGYPVDWWEEIGRTTLSVAGDTITVSGLPGKKYLRIIIFAINTGGTIDTFMEFNNDTGSNYARRLSTNGGADSTAASGTTVFTFGNAAYPTFTVADVINFTAQEKMVTFSSIAQNTAGAGNVPGRTIGVAKWANTANQITRVDVFNGGGGTGDYAIGSEVIVLGHD